MDKITILDIAARQMNRRLGLLRHLIGNEGLGFEKWFQLELYHSLILNGITPHIQNKGPDFVFDDFCLELKAAQMFPANWVRKEGLKYPGVDCLFIGPVGLIDTLKPDHYREVGDEWIVGLLMNEVN